MSRFARILAKTGAALSGSRRRAARPALQLEALGDRIVPSGFGYLGQRFTKPLNSPPVLVSSQGVDQPDYVAPSFFLHHTLDLLDTYSRVSWGRVTLNEYLGPDAVGNYVYRGTFTSGTLQISITATITRYQLGGPLGLTANFNFEGYDRNSGGLAMNYWGTVSMNSQQATARGYLAVYYPILLPSGSMPPPGTTAHTTESYLTYYEPAETEYTAVSGPWF